MQASNAQLVDLAGPFPLAQADHQHLEHARLVRRVEVGVRLDPVGQNDAVGLVGVLVEIDRQADRVGAQNDRIHVGLDGDAHRLGRHAVAGQKLALALGGRAAVAAHRGDDEWLVTHLVSVSTIVRATRSMPWTPRLPIPTAIVPPGLTRSRRRLS